MTDNKFEHEDYYLKKQAEVVLANATNSAWIAAYSAAIIARQEDRALAIAETAVSAFRERCGEGEGEARKDNAGAVVEIDQLVLFLHDDFAAEYDGTESPVECSIRLLTAYKASLGHTDDVWLSKTQCQTCCYGGICRLRPDREIECKDWCAPDKPGPVEGSLCSDCTQLADVRAAVKETTP